MKFELLKDWITEDERKAYHGYFEGFTVNTNDCLKVIFDNGYEETYVIYSGPFTKASMCRDCGEYLELHLFGKIITIQRYEVEKEC